MKKMSVVLIFTLLFAFMPSFPPHVGALNPCIMLRGGSGFDSKYKTNINLESLPFIWGSVSLSSLPKSDLVMVRIRYLENIFSGLRVDDNEYIENVSFSYKNKYYTFAFKDDACYINEGSRSQKLTPGLALFDGWYVVPLLQIAKFIGFTSEFNGLYSIIIYYPVDDTQETEREFDYWSVPLKIKQLDEKAGFVVGVDSRGDDFTVYNGYPTEAGLKVGSTYRFICDGNNDNKTEFKYYWHCVEKNISTTEYTYWKGKDFFRKNGVVFNIEDDLPVIRDGKFLVPSTYWNDLSETGVKETFDTSKIELSIQLGDDFYKFTNGSKTARCYIHRKSQSIELTALPGIIDGAFYIGLDDIAKILSAKVAYKGDMANVSLPYSKKVEKIYYSMQSITNIQSPDLAKGTAKTFKYGQTLDVEFFPPKLLSEAVKAEKPYLSVIRTADDTGRQYFQCFSLTLPKYSGTSKYVESTVKKTDANEDYGVYVCSGRTYTYDGDITHNQYIGDTYKTFATFGGSYMDSGTFFQIDPQTGLVYDKRAGEVIEAGEKIIFKDLLDKVYELILPKTQWGLSQHIRVGDKYWLVGVAHEKSFEVKRFGQYDYTLAPRTYSAKIAFTLPSSVPANIDGKRYIKFELRNFHQWRMDIPCCWWVMLQHEPLVLANESYYSIDAIADLLYANMIVDKTTQTVTYNWNYVEEHQWAYKDMMRFYPDSVNKDNWTVSGFTTTGQHVNLLLQDDYLLDMFVPGKVIWIQANVYDDKTWLLKNVYKSTGKENDEHFSIAFTNKTFVGSVISNDNSELSVKDGEKTKTFPWPNASDYKIGQKLALEFYSEDQKTPVYTWLVDDNFSKVKKHYVYSTKSKYIVDRGGISMVSPDNLCMLFPAKAYGTNKNLTLYNSDQYLFSINDKVVVMDSGSKTAIVDGKSVELSETQRLITDKNSYRGHLVPIRTILGLLGIDCTEEKGMLEATVEAYSNSSANDIFNFDEILFVKDGKSYNGAQTHTLFFANPKLKASMKDHGTYRIVGYVSNIEPDHVFVTDVDEWLP